MFQRVVEQIRGGLLYFLIVETEIRNRRIECGVETNAFALERFLPALGEFIEAIAKIVFAELQNQLAAFERGVIQEHRYEANEPLATFFRFFQNVALLFGQAAERTGEQKIVVALDDGERSFQLVRGGCEENGFLAVYFLQLQIGCEQIAIGDFAFLQQFLNGDLCCGIGRRLRFLAEVQIQPATNQDRRAIAHLLSCASRHVGGRVLPLARRPRYAEKIFLASTCKISVNRLNRA